MLYYGFAALDLLSLNLYFLLIFSTVGLALCAFLLFRADHKSLRKQELEEGERKRWYQRSQFIIALVVFDIALLLLTRIPIYAGLFASNKIADFLFFILSMCNFILLLYGLYIRQKVKEKK